MHPQTVLDFVVFQLTPTRTRYELYAAAGEETEKLASGIVKHFCLHLKAVKEQLAKGGHSIRLQPPVQQGSWFTKGTMQRFIRFVNNPDVLERVGTIEVELKQLEETVRMQTRHLSKAHVQHLRMNFLGSVSPRGARRTLLRNSRKVFQKKEDSPGLDGNSILGNSRKRLLYALEARRTFLQKEQGMSFARATAAGFDDAQIKKLISFADCFGATRLREACVQFICLFENRQETRTFGETYSTTTCLQPNSSFMTRIGPRIMCKLHTTDNSGGSRLLEEGYEGPHAAVWPCFRDKENEICTCQAAKGHTSNHNNTPDENCAPRGSYSSDEDFTWRSLQNSPTVAEEERCSLEGEDYKERERLSIITTGSPCTSQWCKRCCCCCHNPLRGLQAGDSVSTPVCMAPCKFKASYQYLPESEFSSLSLSSQVTNGEPLDGLLSNPSRYNPPRFTIQSNDSFNNECLLSHYFNHNAVGKKKAIHECPSSRKESVAQASIYDQENVSKLTVINNQIFSASHSDDRSAKEEEEMEAAGKCCKEQRCGNELESFHLCVQDMVSNFERRSHDKSVLPVVSRTQESTNSQNVSENVFERWSAHSILIKEECQKSNGKSETMKIDGRETLSNGGSCCVSRVAPSQVRGKEGVGSQCELCPIGSYDLKLLNDKEAGSWNPLYQEFFGVPTNRSFWDCTTEKVSGSSSAKETPSELCSQVVFATDCHIQVPQTSGQAALPQQLNSNASRPSEERVKRFLERYYEKREEKLRNRFYAEKEKAGLTSKAAPLFLDKEHVTVNAKHAESTRNYAPEKSVQLSKRSAQAGKPQTYKEGTPKSKKSKDEDQRRPEGLHASLRERISTNATAGDFPTAKSSQSIQMQRSNSRLSSAKLPAHRKVSGLGLMTSKQKEAAGLLSGSRNTGTPKRARNPLNNSAPSLNKSESKPVGTSSTRASTRSTESKRVRTSSMRASTRSLLAVDNSMRASTRSLLAVDKTRISQIRNSLHTKSMAPTNPADKRFGEVRKASTRKVASHSLTPPIKDQEKSARKNAKGTSLLRVTNEEAKEGPKNFLRKGAGSSRLGGNSQPKFVANKEVDTLHKRASPIASPPLGSQSSKLALGLELRDELADCLLAQQVDAKGGVDGLAKREPVKGVKRKGHDDTTLPPEEPSPLLLSDIMQPTCCIEVHGSHRSFKSQAGAACLDDNMRVSSFSLAEPFLDSLQSNVICIRCDPFEIPAVQERVFKEARSFAQGSSTDHFRSGLSDATRSMTSYPQLRTKGDASRIMSLLEQHLPINNQGMDLKRFLRFGWRNTHATSGSDQASASIFSDEEEERGSFSEPGPRILDCYGRKRHAGGKSSNSRVSGPHTLHCSPSTPEHNESKGRKTIIPLKRSLSTHEVRSKPQDRNISKISAVKATRAFFSLAPFRRKSVEGK